eukprot:1443380-Pleurochrysis_carterae.AAC.3
MARQTSGLTSMLRKARKVQVCSQSLTHAVHVAVHAIRPRILAACGVTAEWRNLTLVVQLGPHVISKCEPARRKQLQSGECKDAHNNETAK